ncbi:MAG: DUF1003 domain-containing protein [Alphaproteobacteria bacterium]|nr:DUF1003 domain-containing protein [Alphaproteobacteria bacterium]
MINVFSPEDLEIINRLRASDPAKQVPSGTAESVGERVADRITRIVGSWPFIITQSVILVLWIAANITAWVQQWDPYPFILLNLALSFQAAYTAPVILMSQNREAALDRQKLEYNYQVNLKTELELELLQHKLDHLEIELLHRKMDSLLELLKSKSAA